MISLLISLLSPLIAKSKCYLPEGNRYELIWDNCVCQDYGFNINYKDYWGDYVCMDRNCMVGKNSGNASDDVKCLACAQGFYISGNFCMPCPSGASCDGYTIQCGDGYFHDGSKCQRCDSSCKTCSGTKNTQCTSCYAGYSLSSGACVKDEAEPTKTNTVNSCPSRMTLSSDGCCCINK